MTAARAVVSRVLLLALLAGPLFAQEEYDVRSPRELSGRDPASGLSFSAAAVGGSHHVFHLERNGQRLRVLVGVDHRELQLSATRAGGGPPARLTRSDQHALARLASVLDGNRPLEHGFLRVLNLLASWPADLPLEASLKDGVVTTADGAWPLTEGEDIADICGKMNQSHDGTYPIFGFPRHFKDLGIVGPYPWSGGDCLGRCGAGCPGDGPPNNSVFAFGQDCFNHDTCVRDLGLFDLDCNLIFLATFDDFLYGPSCQKDNADIVINGQDVPLTVSAGDPIEIRVSLMNVPEGPPVDYWLYAKTPAGTFWLDLAGGWTPGPPPVPALQGFLVNVDDHLVYEGPLPVGFPAGLSTFYLSVDLSRDGSFSPRQFEDALEVTVE